MGCRTEAEILSGGKQVGGTPVERRAGPPAQLIKRVNVIRR